MAERYFPQDEYEARWQKVQDIMAAEGFETAVVFSRSAGTYDRCADVLYLVNYYGNHSGQSIRTASGFAAVIMRAGQEPELIADEFGPRPDIVATPNLNGYADPIKAVANSLVASGTKGHVALVGENFLPVKFWRQLEAATPGIDWVGADDLVQRPRIIKSPRELAAMREAGSIATRALTLLMENLIAGKSEAEAAGEAAREVYRSGGVPHMIPVSHGPYIDYFASDPLPAHNREAAEPGEMVRGWVYGPMFEGYWLDPGRTAVCGRTPSNSQKEVIEANAEVIEAMVAAVKPGATVGDICAIGDSHAADFGGDHSEMAEKWPIYGHGNGLFFENPSISTKTEGADPSFVFQAGMVLGIEAFYAREGVGSAGFEQNIIVTEDGAEVLSNTPMRWW